MTSTPTDDARGETVTGGPAGTRAGSEYAIRRFRPGDERDFLDLFNEVWTAEKTTEWFDWRYRDNPYVDDVPMFVAEHEGRVVAARPFKAFRVRAGDADRLAFLCTDAVTDADHRRQGLFGTMTERALEEYADRPAGERPAFFFNHSNRYSRPGNEKFGWEYLSPQVRYNRVQRAGSYVTDRIAGPAGVGGGAVANGLNRGYLGLRARLRSFDTDRFTVERRPTVPAAVMAECFASCLPDAVHVVYDEAFYRWRFAEPGNEPDACYVVRWDDRPVAGLVVHRDRDPRNDTAVVTISHVVPAAGGPNRTDAVAAAVEGVLRDYGDADLLRTSNPLIPGSVLRAFGFHPDDRFPMSGLAEPSGLTLGIRPLVDGEWDLNGRPIRGAEPSLWTLA